jgi:hypothetical protein
MSNTGNINYSLDKNDFHKILMNCIYCYIPYYIILIIFSIIYIFTIKYQQYVFPERGEKNKIEEDIIHYFKSITYNSPFNIMELNENEKKNGKFVGLSNKSYLFIIISYIITLFIILEGLLRNLLYSIYANVIQVNPNNNPYHNNNCVSKIEDNPNKSTAINYTAIISLSFIFFIPFIIPFILWFFNFDNYDIKHTIWIRYVILFLIFYPLIIILISKNVFYKKLEIFTGLQKFIETKDYSFIQFIANNFNFKIYNIITFLFIIFVYCYYTLIYSDFKYDLKKKVIIFFILFVIIFIFIPIFLVFFALSILFSNDLKYNSTGDITIDINNNGITNIYDLLVKYNYPCFIK